MIQLTRPECPNPDELTRGVYNHPENKAALRSAINGKCMYCEVEVSASTPYDIEHIKPKSTFPQYKFDWNNLGYACPRCNREFKREKYDENLINPYEEDPETHLKFLASMCVGVDGSVKADVTVDMVGLNRPELLAKRAEKLISLQKTVRLYRQMPEGGHKLSVLEQLREEAAVDKEFSLSVKNYLQAEGVI